MIKVNYKVDFHHFNTPLRVCELQELYDASTPEVQEWMLENVRECN